MAARRKHDNLREACIQEALAIIETDGVEALSLREIARRLGVSHQAPYKHFPSRDHVLAEIVSRAYQSFAVHLDARARDDDPMRDLQAMGEAYFAYAMTHPLQYRLMFGTPLPDPTQHPAMLTNARHAFALLTDAVVRVHAQRGTPPQDADMDAMFIWSTVHGMATILNSHAILTLGFAPETHQSMVQHAMYRMQAALTRE
jgi:AcrR family transcriptional regulator